MSGPTIDLTDKYNVGADGLTGFQRDCNNARWRLGVPEDDVRPYLFLHSRTAPKRFSFAVEEEIEDLQMKIWVELDNWSDRPKIFDFRIEYIGPRDSVFSMMGFTVGDDAKILNDVGSFMTELENAESDLDRICPVPTRQPS